MSQKNEKKLRRTVRRNQNKIINDFIDIVKAQKLRHRIVIAYDILTRRIK